MLQCKWLMTIDTRRSPVQIHIALSVDVPPVQFFVFCTYFLDDASFRVELRLDIVSFRLDRSAMIFDALDSFVSRFCVSTLSMPVSLSHDDNPHRAVPFTVYRTVTTTVLMDLE